MMPRANISPADGPPIELFRPRVTLYVAKHVCPGMIPIVGLVALPTGGLSTTETVIGSPSRLIPTSTVSPALCFCSTFSSEAKSVTGSPARVSSWSPTCRAPFGLTSELTARTPNPRG